MNRNRNRIRNRCLLAGAVVVASVPFLIGAGADDPAQLAENRRRIADMSPYERAELQENYAEFRAMPEAEREQLRRLHAELQANAKLRQVFVDYQNWLRTLTPYQRLQVRQETDWSRRLEIVRQLRQEQQSEQQRRRTEDPRRGPLVWVTHRHSGIRLRWLESDDLAAVMRVIQDTLPGSSIEQQLQGTSDPVRYVRILTAALKRAMSEQDASPSNLQWPDARTADRILDVVSDEQDKRHLEEISEENDHLRDAAERRGHLILAMIINSIDHSWWSANKDIEVTDDDVRRILNSLDESTRREIQFESRAVRNERIKWHLLTERRREFRLQEAGELVRIFEEMWPPPAEFRPDGRGFGGPRGDRRPGDHHRGPGDEAPDGRPRGR